MKTLFNKPATFIKYALTIMAFAIILGTVFVIGFGFNTSSDFGGVYELSIDCFDENKISEHTEVAKEVLDEYGYSAKEVIIEDRSICDTIVIRYASKSAVNALKVEENVTTRLELNENLVSVSELKLPSATSDALKMLLALGISIVGIFIYLLVRMDWKRAITVVLGLTLSAVLPVAIFAISRIEISLVALAIVFLMALVSAILVTMIFSKIEAVEKSQQKPLTFIENYLDILNENKIKAIIPTALLLLVYVCMIFTFSRALVFAGLVGFICMLVAAFVAIIFAPNFYMLLNTKRAKKIKK